MDRAQGLTEMHIANALARHKDRQAQVSLGHSKICLVCGDDLDMARLAALPNCCTCVECQETIERGAGR